MIILDQITVHSAGQSAWFNNSSLRSLSKIYVKDYADAKIECVPVAFHFLCHFRPRELPGRGTKGLPCPVVASFGLRHRDAPNFLLCVYPEADVIKRGARNLKIQQNLICQ